MTGDVTFQNAFFLKKTHNLMGTFSTFLWLMFACPGPVQMATPHVQPKATAGLLQRAESVAQTNTLFGKEWIGTSWPSWSGWPLPEQPCHGKSNPGVKHLDASKHIKMEHPIYLCPWITHSTAIWPLPDICNHKNTLSLLRHAFFLDSLSLMTGFQDLETHEFGHHFWLETNEEDITISIAFG